MIMHFMSGGNKESQSDYIQSQGLVSFICLCQDLFISTSRSLYTHIYASILEGSKANLKEGLSTTRSL